VNNQIKTKQ